MSLKVFSQAPYYDDYDEAKKYLRVLFRPGVSLQVRELNQLQTYLQTQIERLGLHLFKDGSMVIPGQSSVDTDIVYLKVESDTNGVAIGSILNDLVGSTLVGVTTGVQAQVITYSAQSDSDPITLFVRYISNGTTATVKAFNPSEVLNTLTGTTISGTDHSVQIKVGAASLGKGSVASIERGIYFVKGQFAQVDSTTIILDKYTNKPSYRIGLNVTENIVTANADGTLNDNANGSPNENAPGAHRYQILLSFTKLAVSAVTDTSFIELIRVEDGQIQSKVSTTDYSQIAKTLARRTYDESGNYTVNPFKVALREHRNNDRGSWTAFKDYLIGDIVKSGNNYFTALNSGTAGAIEPSTSYDATNPYQSLYDGIIYWNYTPNPAFNRGYLTPEKGGDDAKVAVAVEPGKGYVQGYEIEKISTEYVPVDKARTFDRITGDSVPVRFGNYITVTNLRGTPDCSTFPVVKLFNQLTGANPQTAGAGVEVGSARIRAIEFDSGTQGTASGIYKVYLFNVQMNGGYTFERDVKQIFSAAGSTIDTIVADVNNYSLLNGSISASGTTVTGVATSFVTQLKVGDYIRAINSTGVAEVRRVTNATAITNTSLSIDSAFSGTVQGQSFYRVMTAINEPAGMQLLFPLAYSFIRKVKGGDNDTVFGTSYTTTQRFDVTGVSTASFSITLGSAVGATTLGSEFNPSADKGAYIAVYRTASQTESGKVLTVTSAVPSVDGTSCVITLSSAPSAAGTITVFAPVRKAGSIGQEKKKTLISNYKGTTFTSAALVTPVTLSLKKADAYRIVSIRMAAVGTWTASYDPANTTDITDWYTFDNGQRDTHYDVATITRKDGYPIPTGAVQVIFDYFDHSTGTAGDYFTVDSYKDIPYNKIPYFVSTNGIVALADVMDFRPRASDTGSNNTLFTDTGASRTELPKIGFETSTSYSYYLPRRDKLALDIDGKFFTVTGVSDLAPQEPKDPVLGMLLAKLNISAYTLFPDQGSVTVETIDTKRYTMRDIGKLDKRIENLEYYTALSLLEHETKSMTIRDDVGLDRFKNGFIVDSFKGQDVGDVGSVDYRCAIDMTAQELRPFYTMNNVNLIEENQISTDRTSDGYALTGDIITLPYTNIKFIDQPYASRTENVNPFAVFTFLGGMSLNPPSDEWFETDRRPDIINNVEGNFSAVQTQLERSGVLGTIWGAWETQWVGQTRNIDRMVVTSGFDTKDYGLGAGKWSDRRTFSAAELAAIGGNAVNWGQDGVGKRVLTFQTQATTLGQGRVGVATSVTPKIDYEVVDDKILQTAIIPYVRARELLFVCKGMKPNTRLHPFFDDTDISTFVTPATRLSVSNTAVIEFDVDTNVGGAASEFARQVNGKAESSYNKGDVIYVKQRGSTTYNSQAISPATAVAVLKEKTVAGSEGVYVLNIKGTFQTGDILQGSISGAVYTITAVPTVAAKGSSLTSNFNGSVVGVFSIPNTDSIRFRTGIRDFKLTDSVTGGIDFTTQGRSQYRAQGVLETKQKTINAVRNAEVVVKPVSQARQIEVYSDERLIDDTGWYDPLAQTFLVQSQGGAFLTKAEIFFATKDVNIPVTIQIREVVNGYPGSKILPFSKVTLTPDRVNTSADGIVPDANSTGLATTFTFPAPVYMMDNTEYCIVLLSDSNNYRVWVSQLGEKNVGTDRFISEQPYAGVLFKSQNASTWTANQEQDLKFTLYRAKFNTNTQGVISFVNEPLPPVFLESDPFKTTASSNKVRVFHQNHGMSAGSTVIITNVTPATYNGIITTATTGLNGSFTISNIESDSYVITLASGTASNTGYVGGSNVIATQNVAMDAVNVITQSQSFSDTTLGYSVLTTNSGYNFATTEVAVVPNQTTYFDSSQVVASQINENVSALGTNKSLKLIARMSTSNDAISPVIDTARLSMTTIKNRVDTFTQVTKNIPTIDDVSIVSAAPSFAFTSTGLTVPVASRTAVRNITVGKYIAITGATTGTNNGTFLVTAVATDGASITLSGTFTVENATALTIIMKDNFVSEIAPAGGSAVSKYLTRVINLQTASTFAKIMFAANVPAVSGSDIEVWYKLLPTGSNGDISQYNFIQASAPIKTMTRTSNQNQFTDVQYDLAGLPAFDAIVVKLVFKSGNTAQVPRVKDLRVIACA